MTTQIRVMEKFACFGGEVIRLSHVSTSCDDRMRCMVYLPPQSRSGRMPVLYFLAGLTCNEETFLSKGGAIEHAARLGLILVCPDTSPRNAGITGEDASWDFGKGASFYVNATQAPWSKAYNMQRYVAEELPGIIEEHFMVDGKRTGILGHSVGGHGALICAMKYPERFRSVSAFSPMCAASKVPWGIKAFSQLFGDNEALWQENDASELVRRKSLECEILVDQGSEDRFLTQQLRPDLFIEACKASGQKLTLRMQPGYDHSYFFIQTFISEHLLHHAERLSL